MYIVPLLSYAEVKPPVLVDLQQNQPCLPYLKTCLLATVRHVFQKVIQLFCLCVCLFYKK